MLTFSYSKIKLWDECELKFYAHELLKLKPLSSLSSDPKVALGNLVHRYFYEFYKNQIQTNLFKSGQISLEDWKAEFIDEWSLLCAKLIFKEDTHPAAFLERGILALQNFYAREQLRGFKLPIYLEQRFTIDLGEFKLSGIIDRIDREDDGSLTVIDYKVADQMQTCEQADTDLQLTMYHLACEQTLTRQSPAKLALYYPLQNEIVYTKRHDLHLQTLLKKVSTIIYKLTSRGEDIDQYQTSHAEWKCNSCGYKTQCPEHRFEQDLRLPLKEEILLKIEEFVALKSQLTELENKTEELKTEIKDYMLANKLKKMSMCFLSTTQGSHYDTAKVWHLISKRQNGHQLVKALDSAKIKEQWACFSEDEQRELKEALTLKAPIHALRLVKEEF
jgi:RecB family exonuclease